MLEITLEEPLAKRKPGWLKEIVQEVERIVAPKGTFRERKRPHRFGGYVALMRNISDVETYSFEEEYKLQVWKDSMLEEYKSIIKNNVWDIVQGLKTNQWFLPNGSIRSNMQLMEVWKS